MGSGLPTLSLEERTHMAGLPVLPENHEKLVREAPFLNAVEVEPPPVTVAPLTRRARLVCWNSERGRYLPAAAEMLRAAEGDAYLLSELDLGMARSGQHHTARELARRLGCGYAYAVEFLELGLGDERERATHAGQENQVGYHGGGLLSAHALARPEVVRIELSGRWFDGEWGERRVGGRIAVLGTLELDGTPITLASVHLESHSDPDDRCAQLARVFDAVDAYRPGAPVVVAGDVNSNSFTRAQVCDRALLAEAVRAAPSRVRRPMPHEPLFALAEARGYDWRGCNQLEESTQRRKEPSTRGGLHLDWFFCRNLEVADPEVIAAVDPTTGAALSDHETIAVTVALR
jgi:endonuclease/exonuclease/phosphatase family metal-dependent hydrolase